MDTTNDFEVEAAPLVVEEASGASPASEETETVVEEPPDPPHNRLKIDALRRLKTLKRRGKTVGTHLDELRALLPILFEQMPD